MFIFTQMRFHSNEKLTNEKAFTCGENLDNFACLTYRILKFYFTLIKMRLCSCSLEEFFDNLAFDVHVLSSVLVQMSAECAQLSFC